MQHNFESDAEWSGIMYNVIPLHNVPQLMRDCCSLINLEWKRSDTARMRSIGNSCDQFPMSLILRDVKNYTIPVIGHCKISLVPEIVPSVFVESVIIHPDFRGLGLGRLLMRKTEEYLLSRNIETIYLSTQGQELFYKKLGYEECPPVNIYGCCLSLPLKPSVIKSSHEYLACDKSINYVESKDTDNNVIPPPPPLPPNQKMFTVRSPPPFPVSISTNKHCFSQKTFFKKQLCI